MGIEKFFNGISKNNNIKLQDGVTLGLEKKLEGEYIYVDFNSILYNIANDIEKELNYILYEIIIKNEMASSDKLMEKYMKVWNFTGSTIKEYDTYFTTEKVELELENKVIEYLKNIFKGLNDPNKIKKIYIGIDGIPTMGKVIEQKKRRYMGSVISYCKKKIYLEYQDELDQKRKLYESHKVIYDRGKILGSSKTMIRIVDIINSDKFREDIKKILPILNEISVSDGNCPGEGEKKIMENILEYKKEGKYIIFSPDADVIVLAMIMKNKFNKLSIKNSFGVLRFNQQTEQYDYVDIDIIINNMLKYIINRFPKEITIPENKKITIINDICMLFTFFGNDFVPKLESLDVRTDFEILIDNYVKIFSEKGDNHYLTFDDNDNIKISYYNFYLYIKELSNDEKYLLANTYMYSQYKNTSFLSRVFGPGLLYKNLEKYIKEANILYDLILKEIKIGQNSSKSSDDIANKVINSGIFTDSFINHFISIEYQNVRKNNITLSLREQFKNAIINIIKKGDKFDRQLKLYPYEKSVDSKFHLENIKKSFSHPILCENLTIYDKKIYSLERMLDEYIGILNAGDIELGSFDFFSNKDRYYININWEKYIARTKVFYYDFFNINKNLDSDLLKMDNLCENYIKGLMWVFDFYFNKNNRMNNYNKVSIWFYPYSKAPLLYDLNLYLKNILNKGKTIPKFRDYLFILYKSINDSSKSNYVLRKDYMTKLEHYMYITPVNKQHNIPERYEIIKENNQIFPKLDIISEEIIEGRGIRLIDCRRTAFLNKCHLSIDTVSFTDYMNLIKPLRNKNENEILLSSPINYIFSFPIMIGGKKYNLNKENIIELNSLSNLKYNETGNNKYKNLYLQTKKILKKFNL